MKIAGIIFLFLSSAGIGFLKSLFLKTKCKVLDEIIFLINDYRERVAFENLQVSEIIGNLARSGKYSHLEFLPIWSRCMADGDDPLSAFDRETCGLEPDAAEAFAGFCGGLGKTGVDGQAEHCGIYLSVFEKIKNEYYSEYAEKGKLYRNLGVYAGAFLAAFFI